MKTRLLGGLACIAGMAAGCQSPAMKALSRWSKKDSEIQQASATADARSAAGLPGPSQRDSRPSQTGTPSFDAGEVALDRWYKTQQPELLAEARRNFEAAAAADPKSAAAVHRLGIVCDLQSDFGSAVGYYQKAMAMSPGDANITADLGYSYYLQGQWRQAEQYLTRALQQNPKHDGATKNLALVYGQQGNTLLAENTLGQVMSRDQAQAFLANHLPDQPSSALAGGRGVWDKGPQTNAAPATQQELMARMEQARQEGVAAREQNAWQREQMNAARGGAMAPMPNTVVGGNYSMPNAQPHDPHGDYLRNQLAEVDHSGRPQGSPMMIGNNGPGSAPPNAAPPNAVSPIPTTPGDAAGGFPWASEPAAANVASNTWQPQPAAGGMAEIYAGNRAVVPAQGRSNTMSVNPLASDVAVASGESSAAPANWQTPPPSAPGDGLPALPSSTVPPQFGPANAEALAATSEAPAAAAAPPPDVQTYAEARRKAALMGLGLGPGQMFSSLENPAARMSPGTNSHWNGASFPAPARHLPDMQTPPDLSQAPSFFEARPIAPPPNSMGQQMPNSAAPIATADPYAKSGPPPAPTNPLATPASMNAPWAAQAVNDAMAPYNESRQRVDAAQQQALNGAWANSPAQAVGSPSGGVPYDRPAPPSQQMQAWGGNTQMPAPYQGNAMAPGSMAPTDTAALPAINPSGVRSNATTATSGRTTLRPAAPQPYYQHNAAPPAAAAPAYQQQAYQPQPYSSR